MTKKIADKGATEAFLRAHVNYDGEDCLEWPYGRSNRGYGLAVVGGKQRAASRWMCILAHGEPPSDRHEAAHRCGNSGCVNPRHLRWDTAKGNQADRLIHGTHNLGERNGKTRLTEAEVAAIRSSTETHRTVAERYGMSYGGISKIRRGVRWRAA